MKWIRYMAALTLLLYAGACLPLGLGILALAGSCDPAHRAVLRGANGGFQLVLQHGRLSTAHRHGVIAQAITAFSRPESSSNPDHVIPFAASSNPSQVWQTAVGRPASLKQVPAAPASPFFFSEAQNLSSPVQLQPLPALRDTLVCLRSTVLLI